MSSPTNGPTPSAAPATTHRSLLHDQLRWFIRLRWIAGVITVLVGAVDLEWSGSRSRPAVVLFVGAALLIYNALLSIAHRRAARIPQRQARTRTLLLLAWMQLLLDLAALTLLTMWTGGVHSPVSTFFVFHMVFASLLLPRRMAFAAPLAALAMIALGLRVTGQWPALDAPEARLWLGRVVTLITVVYLANHLTHDLRRQRRRLIRQNARIRGLARQLRRQQDAMLQHEKMVALGQMAAGVAHEIANPLASMDSVLQLAQRKPERVKSETLATLRQQVERIHKIIMQMKSFSHPLDVQRQVVSLNDVVGEAIEMVRFDPRIKRTRIERRFSPETGSIAIVPQAIQQVIVNLLVNALDATADVAEACITVGTARDGRWCVIDVTDNGSGIPAEQMRRLFEPFFTTKPVGKGTGLGLSISYGLVRKHGGTISAQSSAGAGSTFSVRLPCGEPSGLGASSSRAWEGTAEGVAVSEKSSA